MISFEELREELSLLVSGNTYSPVYVLDEDGFRHELVGRLLWDEANKCFYIRSVFPEPDSADMPGHPVL